MRISYTRLTVVLIGVFVLFWFIPQNYLRATRSEAQFTRSLYSPIDKDFIIMKYTSAGSSIETRKGEKLTDREGRMRLPLFFAFDVDKWGGYPLIIDGELITIDSAKYFKYSEVEHVLNNLPLSKFFMLLESKPVHASLSMPSDLMILDHDKLRFIDMATGEENKEKSKLFTEALLTAGLKFPFIAAANNPTTRKDVDEGMFIVDTNNTLFQLIMEEGSPVVRNTNYHIDGNVRNLTMKEDEFKRDYGFIVTDDRLYLNRYDNSPLKLPIDYKAGLSIDVWSTALNRTFEITDFTAKGIYPRLNVAMDMDYNVLDTLPNAIAEEDLKRHELVNKGLSVLTPFRFSQYTTHIPGVKFKLIPSDYLGFIALGSALSILLYLGFFYFRYRIKQGIITRNKLEIILCAVFGLPAALMLMVFGPIGRKKI